ncbi:MAG: NUDIX hydrolase [Heyndrickxia sp.]
MGVFHIRNRGSAVIFDRENRSIALIKRNREGIIYYVFPGGGMEEGETPEEATIREAYEELGVKIAIKDLLRIVDFNGTQYFYLAEITDGEFGTGMGEEFTNRNRDRGTYEPVWLSLEECISKDIRPSEVMDMLLTKF